MQQAKVIFIVLSLLGMSSCSLWSESFDWRNDNGDPEGTLTWGPQPVYVQEIDTDIRSEPARDILNGSSVFTSNNLLFTVDLDQGVHIDDNEFPGSPRPLVFISIPGVRTASILRNSLFANNWKDLVTIDISDLENVRVLDRDEDFYPELSFTPPNHRGGYECYDPSKGELGGWIDTLITPNCRIL